MIHVSSKGVEGFSPNLTLTNVASELCENGAIVLPVYNFLTQNVQVNML